MGKGNSDIHPGSEVVWTHFYEDGTEVVRRGTVWSDAPQVHGNCGSWWVNPDEPLDTDHYAVISVSRAWAKSRMHAGRVWESDGWSPAGGRLIEPYEMFSEQHPHSSTGAATVMAAKWAARIREENRISGDGILV